MVWLLGFAALGSALMGDMRDSALIVLIVVINVAIGFFQENRAEQALDKLKQLAQPTARVIRDGRLQELPARDLVPGDLVDVGGGSLAPADARIINASDLQVDEAPLTGESLPVHKHSDAEPADAQLGDRRCMLHSGTAVLRGRGRVVVTATGSNTELGAIAGLLSKAESGPAPLARRIGELSRFLAMAVGGVCTIVFVAGLLRHNAQWQTMLVVAVSLAVAAIPEGLPAVVTIALALGSQRMAKRKAIVRQLSAVETLGSVSVICTDKTGTLTQNRMAVVKVAPAEGSPQTTQRIWETAILCNDTRITEEGLLGSATERALLEGSMSQDFDVHQLRSAWPRRAELPFDSMRKRMSTLHESADKELVWHIKGAAESVVGRSSRIADGDRWAPLDDRRRDELMQHAERMAQQGQRILAVARRDWPDAEAPASHETVERNLDFLGFIVLADPIRPEVRQSIELCKSAGIRVVMVTGDHASTARRVAHDLGILGPEDLLLTGKDLERMDDKVLAEAAARVAVYARVTPEHKLRIVKAEQAAGRVTAMTGDGVNDAPALKQADIGIAMGITGTDVSKQAAKMVLADENFATIVAAVEEGRVVYDNIRKFVQYLLAANFGEILILFVAVLAGWPLPLLPIQLLWVNLVTDGLPAVALAFEKAEPGTMSRRPRSPQESIFAGGMIRTICGLAVLMAAACLFVFRMNLDSDAEGLTYARTLVFTTASMFQLFLVLALRSRTELFFGRGLLANYRLLVAVLLGGSAQMLVVYWPAMQPIFHTCTVSVRDMAAAMLFASSGFAVLELSKLMRRRWNSPQS